MNIPKRTIHINGHPYLERYALGTVLGVTFYLHRFLTADGERHVHNHPWGWGRALILRGGYQEERGLDLGPDGMIVKLQSVRWWNRVDGNDFHRIASVEPGTVTLFMHGPRVPGEGWGFFEGLTFRPQQSEPMAHGFNLARWTVNALFAVAAWLIVGVALW